MEEVRLLSSISKGPMKGKELFELVVGIPINWRKKYGLCISNQNAIAGLEMMLNYPQTWITSEKVNKKGLKNLLDKMYCCWGLNFKEVYTDYQQIVS